MPDLSPELLRKLLGMRPPETGPPPVDVTASSRANEVRREELRLGAAGLPATCLVPETPTGLGVLYCHAHGNRPDIGKAELTEGRPALCDPPLGLELARAGATVMCVDMPGFGARQSTGGESALAKAALWQGQTLLGDMLADQDIAYRALAARRAVDPHRIATVGISMGGTLAYMHAALSPCVAACAHLCVMADMGPLIATGAHDLHGPYLTIPGLLPRFEMGEIAALIAPRPQFVATGGRDPLTPEHAYRAAQRRLQRAYATAPDRLTERRAAHSGHIETPEMRKALFGFLGLTAPA